ncbi:MAG: HD domain-containing protein [Pseudomonadota bacterium]
MTSYFQMYETALLLAITSHKGQFRKGTSIPYIVHPVHVSNILSTHGFREEVVVAGLLHDVVEDNDVTVKQIEQIFGRQVSEIINVVTEKKYDVNGKVLAWEIRRKDSLRKLREGNISAIAVKVADVYHNAATLLFELQDKGSDVWLRFNAKPHMIVKNYKDVCMLGFEQLDCAKMVDRLSNVIIQLEQFST